MTILPTLDEWEKLLPPLVRLLRKYVDELENPGPYEIVIDWGVLDEYDLFSYRLREGGRTQFPVDSKIAKAALRLASGYIQAMMKDAAEQYEER